MNWAHPYRIATGPYMVYDLPVSSVSGSGQTTVYSSYYAVASSAGWFAVPGMSILTSPSSWTQVSIEWWSDSALLETSATLSQVNVYSYGSAVGNTSVPAYAPVIVQVNYAFTRLRYKVRQLKAGAGGFSATPFGSQLIRLALL